ncbi:WD40-repeat-containing domain protein [Lipomyces oligophaga]|uniref:WD40-repeat-containing domain protein n=1 Tax=Lipomyces oligophaga TaxID=45792 RepID=UPI0034CE9FAE
MTSTSVVPKYVHTAGLTRVAYSADGKFLLTVGTNRLVRKFLAGDEAEPESLEIHDSEITGLATSHTHFATCSEDGTAYLSSLSSTAETQPVLLARQAVPFRDIAFSPDGLWVGVAGDDTKVKLINVQDITRTITLAGHKKGLRHISFHPNGVLVSTSSIDSTLRIYDISSEEDPQLVKEIDGLTPAIRNEFDETSAKVCWHPDGRTFATQNKTRSIICVSRSMWANERSFAEGHMGPINDFAWSPNGAYLATAGSDNKILIWDTRTQNIVERLGYKNVISIQWNPTKNDISFTTNAGQLYTIADVLPDKYEPGFGRRIHPSPLIHEVEPGLPLVDDADKFKGQTIKRIPAGYSDDAESDTAQDLSEWIVDDDGLGYVPALEADSDADVHSGHKRFRGLEDFESLKRKYKKLLKSAHQEPFQAGSTPWMNSRRYLALTSIGYIWTIDQGTYNTVTVSFFDRESHRDYHFTDHFLFDKACLTEGSTLFSNNDPKCSRLFYKSHISSTGSWEVTFPNETVDCIALSSNLAIACTSKGYVRVYSMAGSPLRIYRQSTNPVVTCACYDDFAMTVRNADDGSGKLVYSIENFKFDETFQKNDVLDIPVNATLESLFFSDQGDPCIFDSSGVLLVLMHWRQPLQAKWIPILDTENLGRDNPDETFWPLGLVENKFQCIILKGGEKYPQIPLPVFSELELQIPVYTAAQLGLGGLNEQDKDEGDIRVLEERYVRQQTLFQLSKDSAAIAAEADEVIANDLARKELEIDKTMLQLIHGACKSGQDGRASVLVDLIRQDPALKAAGKIAQRFEMISLAEKINREIEQRMGDR